MRSIERIYYFNNFIVIVIIYRLPDVIVYVIEKSTVQKRTFQSIHGTYNTIGMTHVIAGLFPLIFIDASTIFKQILYDFYRTSFILARAPKIQIFDFGRVRFNG